MSIMSYSRQRSFFFLECLDHPLTREVLRGLMSSAQHAHEKDDTRRTRDVFMTVKPNHRREERTGNEGKCRQSCA